VHVLIIFYRSEIFTAYKTSSYKLHFFESATGFKFILLTDPSVGNIQEQLKHIYKNIFVEYVKKNPVYKLGAKVTCHLFEEVLEKYAQSLNFYSS